MNKYTIAVDNVVEVPVRFTLKAGKVNKPFVFTLTATRIPQDDLVAKMKDVEFKFKEGLQSMGVITGWEGQRLVLGEDGNPADFDDEALDALLSVAGVAQVVYLAYLKECGAKEKN